MRKRIEFLQSSNSKQKIASNKKIKDLRDKILSAPNQIRILKQKIARKNEKIRLLQLKVKASNSASVCTRSLNTQLKKVQMKENDISELSKKVKELSEQLKKYEKEIQLLENENMKLKEEEMCERETQVEIHAKRDEKTYSTLIRLIIYEMLLTQVPTKNISEVISTIYNRMNISIDKIPSRSLVEQMVRELGVISEVQAAELLLKHDNSTLAFDATTQEGVHVNAI